MFSTLFDSFGAFGSGGSILAILAVLVVLAGPALLAAWPSSTVPVVCLSLRQTASITATTASIVTLKVPFNCRIIRIQAGVGAIDDATTVGLTVHNTPTSGSAYGVSANLAVAADSAIVSGGVGVDPDDGDEVLTEDAVLYINAAIAGGTDPVVTGLYAHVWVQRLP